MKITKTQLKQIIKEELSRVLQENEGMLAEEVTHEEVIEKVQELPQGALAKIWAFIKAVSTGDPVGAGIMTQEEFEEFKAQERARHLGAGADARTMPDYPETRFESRERKK